MPEFNSCAKLSAGHNNAAEQYEKLLLSGLDPFAYMLDMQFKLQKHLAKTRPENNVDPESLKTIGQKFDWLRENKQAFDDEYREIIDALPGLNETDSDRSAVWKRWKTKYTEIRSKTFDDLTENELTELKYELTDSFHFFMNMFFALDMSAKELFMYYYTKNAENFNRANSGY